MLELRNTYYAALPTALQKKWKEHLTLKEFSVGDPLEINKSGGFIYFPITCVAMIGIRANGCPSTFLRFSGHSAIIGVAKIFHISKVELEATICCGGYGFAMPAKVLSQYLHDTRLSTDWNTRYISLLLEEVSISAYCNQSHDSSQRVARVLLEAFDNLPGGSEVTLTHSKLADLVGVRRETVSLDLGKWTHMGIISTKKGAIKIEHRELLSEIACDCYRQDTNSRFTALDLWKSIPWVCDDR
ncbi:MAG: helix-turn-helix domain-containing protein [Proteobacteria bacterium]|nr:helix-turn-helix domain-containing protein [Pseudomonadota bacterium]